MIVVHITNGSTHWHLYTSSVEDHWMFAVGNIKEEFSVLFIDSFGLASYALGRRSVLVFLY